MPPVEEDDESPDQFEEREYPEDEEADWNLDPADEKCPHCGGEITEDTVRCPHCGIYISKEDAPAARKPWWMMVGFILIIGAMVVAFLLMR